MMVDYHVHTRFCGHAEGSAEEYIIAAREHGIGMMAFTDHAPLWYLPGDYPHQELGRPLRDLEGYLDHVRLAQWWTAPYPVAVGMELDYIPGCGDEMRRTVELADPDFVIGSIHFLEGALLYDTGAYVGMDPLRVWERYFESAAEAAETGCVDAIGHIDVLKSFLPMPIGALDAFQAAAARISAMGVSVEVNSGGLKYGPGVISPEPELLRICREEGVTVTMGSDAHRPCDVGLGLEIAVERLMGAGYRELAVYKGRKREMVPLG